MKKNLLSILVILFVPIIAYLAFSKTTTTAKMITDTDNKPQVIKFTSTMCLDCQKMNAIFKEIFPNHSDKIILTEIQVQDGKSFTNSQIKKYNVTLVPTIILIDRNGKQVKRIEGAVERNKMEQYLKELE